MTALVVGSPSDGHVQAVLRAIEALGAEQPLLLDAPTLRDGQFALTHRGLTLNDLQMDADESHRGWLRRYAPSGWGTGIVAGSLDAAIHRSFLTLVGSIARSSCCDWLTPIDSMLRAEDRLVQLDVAAGLGILVPRTIVTSSEETAIAELGSRFVVKPLSLGYFVTEDGPQAVFTSEMDATTARQLDFGGAPFAAQQMVETERHYRVVTVGDKSWLASLEADGRPLDWRQQERAHREWQSDDDMCGEQALRLTKALGIGYSSQDWLGVGDQRFFIDLNPGGQWLFLPPETSGPVTQAIAEYLS